MGGQCTINYLSRLWRFKCFHNKIVKKAKNSERKERERERRGREGGRKGGREGGRERKEERKNERETRPTQGLSQSVETIVMCQ